MKCLLVTNDFAPNNPGGMTRHYTGLARGFPEGTLCVLTVEADGPTPDASLPAPVYRAEVREEEIRRFYNNVRWYRRALRVVEEESVDVVLCGNFRPFAYVAYALRLRTGLPYLVFFHGKDLLRARRKMDANPVKRWFYRRILRSAAGFVANSSDTAARIRRLLDAGDAPVLRCLPAVTEAFAGLEVAEPFPAPGRCRLLTAGRLTPRKGVDTVIRALPALAGEIPDLRYRVVGRGDPAPFRRVAREAGVEERVEFTGFLPEEALHRAYREADVLVMVPREIPETDDVEGFGIVYLEANAHGKPVVGSRSGGVPDAVLHGETGLLVEDPADPDAVAEAVLRLYRDPDEARRLGREGRWRVNEEFRYGARARRLLAELEEVVGR